MRFIQSLHFLFKIIIYFIIKLNIAFLAVEIFQSFIKFYFTEAVVDHILDGYLFKYLKNTFI
jgi:ABC-type Fe3+ transport system permease subunit